MHEQATHAHDQGATRRGNQARRREQHRAHRIAAAQLRRKGTVLVVDGHGVSARYLRRPSYSGKA